MRRGPNVVRILDHNLTFQMVHKMLFIVLTYFVADFLKTTPTKKKKILDINYMFLVYTIDFDIV